jgi:hypothetical protein
MTMAVENPQTARMGMNMQMEMDLWLSSDPPGVQEVHAIFQKNMEKLPWAAMAGGAGSPAIQKEMADMQRKIASLGGITVMHTIRVRMGGNGAQAAQMQQGMEQARAQLEAMRKQGGAQAAAAEQAMARMGAMNGGGPMVEIATESTGFSRASIPDSVFAVPAGYTKQ